MSPRTAEANEILHGERRMTILDTALVVFVEQGFEGTRMQEIAERCALSYGLVYHYFSSKEAVFRTLVEMALGAAGSLIAMLPKGSPPAAFGSFVTFALADPSPLYFALIVEALTKRGVPTDLAAKTRETVLGFKASIAAAGGGIHPGDADALAEAILALLLGTSIMKSCGLSDGSFACRSATLLAAAGRE
jgi:AcrR family transcriptional regulator